MAGPQSPSALAATLGPGWELQPLGRSAFCETWQARRGALKRFVKSAAGPAAAMLRSEADGLQALAATGCIRVPRVESLGKAADGSVVLALEWLDFAPADAGFGRRFGQALASLHAAPCPLAPAAFGWRIDNHLGATPQRNTPPQAPTRAGWQAFVAECRLGWMRDRLPPAEGQLRDAVDQVIQALPALLPDAPAPSLIHGDLWQGNWGMLAGGAPVVFDPAVSCSDPGAEIAMMELFGGTPAGFRAGYEEAGGSWPSARAVAVHQLYHLLNHVVLFGGGYARQALRVARSLA